MKHRSNIRIVTTAAFDDDGPLRDDSRSDEPACPSRVGERVTLPSTGRAGLPNPSCRPFWILGAKVSEPAQGVLVGESTGNTVGSNEGIELGSWEGTAVGDPVIRLVGASVGRGVGGSAGLWLGEGVGRRVGLEVGRLVGDRVGGRHKDPLLPMLTSR